MKTHLNLMTLESRRRHLVMRHVARWSRVTALFVALAAVCWWRVSGDVSDVEARLNRLSKLSAPYREEIANNRKLRLRIQVAEQRKYLFNQLSFPQQPLQLVGIISASAREQEGKVQIVTFALGPHKVASTSKPPTQRRSRRGAPPKPKKETVTRSAVNLSGIADDDLTLSRFVASLRETGVFLDVELKWSGNVANSDDKQSRAYELSCIF